VFPPPLPGSLQGEPFPPARDLPAPEFRMRSTPPSGSLLLNKEILRPSEENPQEQIIRELRQTIVLLREKMAAADVAPSPIPPAPVSLRTMTKRELAKVGSQWTLLLGLLAVLLPIAAKKWPAYADFIEAVRSLLP
jgi:hypothetical protein